MNKTDYFKKEYTYIKNPKIVEDTKTLVNLLPDYFFSIPASSTGKYHPKYAATEHGLVKHVKVACKFADILLHNNSIGYVYNDHQKDLIIMALILHDGLKSGVEHEKYTRSDHPLLISKLIMDNIDKLSLNIEEVRILCSLVESHMGEWNYDSYTKEEILPKPTTGMQRFVHMCDFLASKKFINVDFNDIDIDD